MRVIFWGENGKVVEKIAVSLKEVANYFEIKVEFFTDDGKIKEISQSGYSQDTIITTLVLFESLLFADTGWKKEKILSNSSQTTYLYTKK